MHKHAKIALFVSLLIVLSPILAYLGYCKVQATLLDVAYGKSQIVIGVVMQVYTHATGHLPHNVGGLSWRVELLRVGGDPDGLALYKQFHLDEPWDSPHNRKLIEKIPSWLQDPEGEKGYTCWRGIEGEGCAFDHGKTVSLEGNLERRAFPAVVLAKEACPWTKPADVPVAEVEKGTCLRWFKDGVYTQRDDSGDGYTHAVRCAGGGEIGWWKTNHSMLFRLPK